MRRIVALLLFAFSAVAQKPIVVFSRPEPCLCEEIERAIAHPAMQRRLAAVDFRTATAPSGERPSIAVLDPSARQAMRWPHATRWLMLADILTLVEGAEKHLLRASGPDPFVAEREWALAVLALGGELRGRELLQTMRTSKSAENRELAAIWLERLASRKPDTKPRETLLSKYARDGSTDRVRFEAWMALGDTRVEQGRLADAIAAYDRAAQILPDASVGWRSALAARQSAIDLGSPVLGLDSPGAPVAGVRTVWPRDTPKATARVEYRLDGKVAATARKRPFAAGVHFGSLPARQVLEVIAFNRAGKVLSRASTVVNERSEAFDVKFVEAGPVVEIEARVPRGRSIDEVYVELNGQRVARFTAPPYRTRIDAGGEIGVLRAVLRLDDGSEVEDVRMLNAGEGYDAEAHLVEIPAYFDGAASDVTVREAGKTRTVERVIAPADAPLLIGLLIDSSGSMAPNMLDVLEAAVRFVEKNIEPRDRTMVVAFDRSARVRLRPTGNRALVQRSILSISPRGATSLYDSLITSLLQLHSPGSRKALVVFSDGWDVSSRFTADDAAEMARRAGVPVYVLAFMPPVDPNVIDVAQLEAAKRVLMSISERSGGKAFEMSSLEELGLFWDEIATDLRKQSLVIYRTDSVGEEWRTLEVTANGRPVRAPAGVFVTTR